MPLQQVGGYIFSNARPNAPTLAGTTRREPVTRRRVPLSAMIGMLSAIIGTRNDLLQHFEHVVVRIENTEGG